MKNIDQLSEKEILELTGEQIATMIRLRKAEEGIQLLPKPEEPQYFDVADPDKVVYSCQLFGDTLVFEDVEEINSVLSSVSKTKTKCCLEYDWKYSSNERKYIKRELKSGYQSPWDTITTTRVYSPFLPE